MERSRFGTREKFVLVLLCAMLAGASQLGSAAGFPTKPKAIEIAAPENLPELGKWMIAPDGSVAHWLGSLYRGKKIREPINIVVIDPIARSEDEAKARLVKTCATAGYLDRQGHSSGYFGFIAGSFYGQVPGKKNHAFSNEPFEFNNNHGRIFGPYRKDGSYYFIGALSREAVAPLEKVKHSYVSFNQARDDFSHQLDFKTDYKIIRYVQLGNAAIADHEWTTGDHDGVAVVLSATK